MNDSNTKASPRGPWLKTGLLALGAVVVLAGGFGVARAAASGGMGFLHGHGGAMGHDFVQFRLAQALDKVGATDAQRAQIKTIVDAGLAKHQDMAAAHQQIHAQLLAAVSGATVDRAAIEAGSKDLAKTLGDVADVLTPAQRAQLAELHQQHRDQ